MSQSQYNSLMSGLLNQKHALTKLRVELKGRKEKMCWCYRKFGHLAYNCRNKRGEIKRKPIPQNKFEIIASRVMQCGVGGEVKVRRQEVVKEVQCFRYKGIGYYKWECPNIEVEKEKRRWEETAHPIKKKAQQQEEVRRLELAHSDWEKAQEYCGVENMPEDAQLLELGWMTGEVIATYIEYRLSQIATF